MGDKKNIHNGYFAMNPIMPIVRGTWPGRLTMKSGWGRAHARPWNDAVERASLRLERGSAAFLRDCALWLFESAAPDVVSVPLTGRQVRPWTSAGFTLRRTLMIMECDLAALIRAPVFPTFEVPLQRSPEVISIDEAAFDPEWQINRLGLEDALSATPTSTLLAIEFERTLVGFAVSGLSASIGYLQRIAVAPQYAGSGYGRSLLRASMQWARRRGAYTMLLNTDNPAATTLYRSEGFEELPEPLVLMGMRRESHR